MKVRCKKCKKNFDYSLYGGVCPKCGTYYRETEEEKEDVFSLFSGTYKVLEEEEKTESNSSFSPQEGAAAGTNIGEYKPLKEEKIPGKNSEKSYKVPERRAIKRKRHGKVYYGVTLFLIGSMVAAVVLSYAYVNTKNETGKKQMELQSLPEPEIIRKGDAFTYERTNQDGEAEEYSISITQAERMKSKKLNVPEGYEMMGISYHVENAAWEGDDYEEYGITRSISIPVHPYLVTKSREYVKPVPAYSIAEMMNWDYEREEAEGLSDDFTYEDGVIYYLVKENDMEALWISQHEYDAENFREMGLIKSILIKDLGE